MRWTQVRDEKALGAALKLARGCYQRDILLGNERMSGAGLRGRARQYSAHYKTSRENLISRIRAAGIPIGEIRGSHNSRILVIGDDPTCIGHSVREQTKELFR